MRKLRFSENADTKEAIVEPVETPRKLRATDTEVKEKIDRLFDLQSQFAIEEKQFKEKTNKIKSEIDGLKKYLLEYGEENKLERLSSQIAVVTFSSRVSRKIDPKQFLVFLNSHGKAKSFYDFVDVPLTNVIKNFGEAVLESSGALKATVNPYAGLKVSAAN